MVFGGEFAPDVDVRRKAGSGRINIVAFDPTTKKFVIFEFKSDLDENKSNQASD